MEMACSASSTSTAMARKLGGGEGVANRVGEAGNEGGAGGDTGGGEGVGSGEEEVEVVGTEEVGGVGRVVGGEVGFS